MRTELAPIRRRRSYPKTLKAQIVAECKQPGASIAAIALSHGINANLVHRWIRQGCGAAQSNVAGFVPVMMNAAVGRHIEIRLTRASVQATVQWPVSEAGACVSWLREWLK
jgi:transposase